MGDLADDAGRSVWRGTPDRVRGSVRRFRGRAKATVAEIRFALVKRGAGLVYPLQQRTALVVGCGLENDREASLVRRRPSTMTKLLTGSRMGPLNPIRINPYS